MSTVRINMLVNTLNSHVPVVVTVSSISMGWVILLDMIILAVTQPFHAKKTVHAVSIVVALIHNTAVPRAPLLASPAPQRVGTVV